MVFFVYTNWVLDISPFCNNQHNTSGFSCKKKSYSMEIEQLHSFTFLMSSTKVTIFALCYHCNCLFEKSICIPKYTIT